MAIASQLKTLTVTGCAALQPRAPRENTEHRRNPGKNASWTQAARLQHSRPRLILYSTVNDLSDLVGSSDKETGSLMSARNASSRSAIEIQMGPTRKGAHLRFGPAHGTYSPNLWTRPNQRASGRPSSRSELAKVKLYLLKRWVSDKLVPLGKRPNKARPRALETHEDRIVDTRTNYRVAA